MPSPPPILISSRDIQDRVSELGRMINTAYPPNRSLVLIGVLRGAVYFLADLSRSITRSIEIDFISVSSYAGTQSTGKITLHQDIAIDIENKDILIVEDIVDTGRTLNALIQHFVQKKPRSIKTCTFLDKPSRREVSVPTHYSGFRIPDHFVVGYGLDYEQAYRNLPYVGTLPSI
ncbi:MAG: hypoxanthine phosphoribosyltransferase [Candidatus Latescibacteria bacterium]|nr:hypoxanthine phosphoribosyltransferase [Candidatus Latescibacterota bacterium]